MMLTLDTNILVRMAVNDDAAQATIARAALAKATSVCIPSQTLCEYVWVLSSSFRLPRREIASSIRALAQTDKVVLDAEGVDAGLAMLDRGGDFADGIIAYEGRKLGGTCFVSFDRKAVRLVNEAGIAADLLK